MMNQKTLSIDRNRNPKQALHLKGTREKPGTMVMYAFLFGSWLMVALWLIVSLVLYNYNWQWASLMLFSTIAFAWYLRQVNAWLDALRTREYDLKLDSDKVKFASFDFATGQRLEKTLLWKAVRCAEVYRYSDDLTLVLQGWDDSIEIPLWAFGHKGRAIMQVLKSREIPVVLIP